MKTCRRWTLGGASAFAVAGALTCAMPAAAQEPGVEATVIDDVVVTAQRRAENVQDVPMAITAISGEDLAERQILTMVDLRSVAPNVLIEGALGSGSTAAVFMRGHGQINPSFYYDAPVAIYSDGVYYARAAGSLVDLFDVERVEILRGPQGTLYGRNASAGAIRIVSKAPPLDAPTGAGEVEVGERGQRNVRLAVGLPIVEDRVGFRVALASRDNDGFMVNTASGTRAMSDDILSGRASLLARFSEQTSLTLRAELLRDRSTPPGSSSFAPGQDADPFTFGARFEPFNDIDTQTYSATFETELGGAALSSITAFRTVDQANAADGDGKAVPAGIFENLGQNLEQSQFSQEIYLTGDRGSAVPFDWVVGAFYFQEQNDFNFRLRILPFLPANAQLFGQTTEAYGVYGQIIYPLLDERVNLTAGLRYSEELKDFQAHQILESGAPNPAFDFADSISVSRTNWHLALDFHATDDVLFYVQAGTGFRAGGFNGNALNRAQITSGRLATETSFLVEGGVKSEFFDDRLRLNATYFVQDTKDRQFEVLTSTGITNINSNVTVSGIELEVVAAPTPGLELFGNLGTLNDQIENVSTALPRAAPLVYQVGLTYERPVGPSGSLQFGAKYSYTDDYFTNGTNDPLLTQSAYGLLDANLTYRRDNWFLRAAGTNLTDEKTINSGFSIPGLVQVRTPAFPRRWLVTLGYSF